MTPPETNLVPVSPQLPRLRSRTSWRIGTIGIVILIPFLVSLGATFLPFISPTFLPFAIFLVTVSLYRRHQMRKMVQSNQDAAVLLAKGRVAKAKQMYFDLVQKSASYPNLQALFLHNYGIATMRMGDLEEAYRHCNTALSSGWLTRKSWFGSGVYVQLCMGMAILQTLRGELEDAHNWLEQAKKTPTEASQAEVVSAEMLFLVRTGEWDKALQLYHRSYHEFKDLLPAPALRRMYLLRAFAEEQQKGSSYREVASELTAQLRDASATEFAFLTTRWPELQEFVAHLGFSPSQGIVSETHIS